MNNLILRSDSYKFCHHSLSVEGTEKVYAYFEARGGYSPHTLFFGMQYYLKEYLTKPITQKDIDEAEWVIDRHMGPGIFNRAGWEHILKKHGGYLPLKIKAVHEGTIVPIHNVLFTVENTDPECVWLVGFIETLLSKVFYTTTVATTSYNIKQTIKKYLEETGDPKLIDYKLNDFGYRGVSSEESAKLGGMAHLVNFKGTDNIAGLLGIKVFYERTPSEEIYGHSIRATEHQNIICHGRDNELQAYSNLLDKFPTGLIACVSDSYDLWNAVENLWGDKLKERILNRDGVMVIRPDSGNPVDVTLKLVQTLCDKFGYTVNEKGYKVPNPKVTICQGDGINKDSIGAILENFKKHGFSSDPIVFGCGSGLLQQCNRDTHQFAYKICHLVVNGSGRDVWKSPITDPGKSSKRGRLALIRRNGVFTTVSESEAVGERDFLIPVFENGRLLADQDFKEIRSRSNMGTI